MKIVINRCYGGFSVSQECAERMAAAGSAAAIEELGQKHYSGFLRDVRRDDPLLVEAVEALGEAADGSMASLTVVEIPDDVKWQIEEYDGMEWVAETHRTWS